MLTKTDEVVASIVQRIYVGELSPGERLPPSETLASTLGVSRGTARTALLMLRAREAIYKRGNSWYVERRRASR